MLEENKRLEGKESEALTTMMVHVKDTLVANGAVVCASWLHFLAGQATPRPDGAKRLNGLRPVLHKALYVLAEALVSIVCLLARQVFAWPVTYIHSNFFSAGSVLRLLSLSFGAVEVLRTPWPHRHCEKMVEHYVV